MEIVGKKIFITGGAGFIGTALAHRLVEANEIVIYDNLARNSLAQSLIGEHKNLRLIVGDVLDRERIREAMAGCRLIVHCAGIAGIDTVIKSPVRTMEVNMIGSANVLAEAARLPDCERVVCFSTSEVFGSFAFGASEEHRAVIGAVGEARWTYSVSKLAEEHLAIAYHKETGLPASVVRPFNIYGPRQIGEGALKIFIERALRNLPIDIHGDGTQIRAWCFIDDMVEGVLLAMSHPKAVGESFNIGNARSVETIYGLANTVVRVLESRSPIRFVPRASADVELRIPAVKKARELLGFEAKVGLEEGIQRTAAHYRQAAAV